MGYAGRARGARAAAPPRQAPGPGARRRVKGGAAGMRTAATRPARRFLPIDGKRSGAPNRLAERIVSG